MANVMKPTRFGRFVGRWRLLFGFCPRCNSDAPAVDTCDVCRWVKWEHWLIQNHNHEFPPIAETKTLWWSRFIRGRTTYDPEKSRGHDYVLAEASPSGKTGWRCTACDHYTNSPTKAKFAPCPVRDN